MSQTRRGLCSDRPLSPVMQQLGGHKEGAGADTGLEGQLLHQPCGHDQEGLGLQGGYVMFLVSQVNGNLVICDSTIYF